MKHMLLLTLMISFSPVSLGQEEPAGSGILLPRQDCRTLLPRPGGGVWVVGVEDVGDPGLSATRQQVVLGEVVDEKYRAIAPISTSGFVFFPAAAVRDDTIWVVWSQFTEDNWRIFGRRWSHGEFSPPTRISAGETPALWGAVVISSSGVARCAFSAPGPDDFDIWYSSREGSRWGSPSRVTGPGFHEMRPALAVADRSAGETIWLGYDYFADGGRYRVDIRERGRAGWGDPVRLMSGQQSPHLTVAPDGTLWVTTIGGGIAGWRDGRKLELTGDFAKLLEGENPWPVSLDEGGRLWVSADFGRVDGGGSRVRLGAVVGSRLEAMEDVRGQFESGAHRPILVHGGKAYLANNTLPEMEGRLYILAVRGVSGEPAALREGVEEPPPSPPRRVEAPGGIPRVTIRGEVHRIYFGELHTHLGEVPSDIALRTWVDRYYLDARYGKGLDVAAVSDHDWPPTTQSKYLVQQAIAGVLTEPGEFIALSGFEWSGDGPTRKRYGDRTVIFRPGYFAPPRISDPESNTPLKLHAALRRIGAIDWPHHVGAPWAVMDWETFEADVEPVVEITSQHGVFETYDEKRAVPVEMLRGREPLRSLEDRKTDRTSIQYALSRGHRFGIVGSSDSHTGFSRNDTGMLALLATELTAKSVFEAWRARRVYALRGGDRIRLWVRCEGAVLGGETSVSGAPSLRVEVGGSRRLERVEVIRDNQYIYTVRPSGMTTEFDYRDLDAGPGEHYYYVRVWQEEGGYAWSSPLWVTVKPR